MVIGKKYKRFINDSGIQIAFSNGITIGEFMGYQDGWLKFDIGRDKACLCQPNDCRFEEIIESKQKVGE